MTFGRFFCSADECLCCETGSIFVLGLNDREVAGDLFVGKGLFLACGAAVMAQISRRILEPEGAEGPFGGAEKGSGDNRELRQST